MIVMRKWPIRKLTRGTWRSRLISGTLALVSPVLLYLVLTIAFPLDLSRTQHLSTEILDDRGRPLRIYLSEDGYLRLPVTPDQVDPHYLKMLIAYEDKRFYRHIGIDPLAMVRAITQAVTNGRIVSGGSTLTMQVARLLEPRERTVAAKIIEMFRALQLEQKFTKDEILSIYLTLAPFGGNREGIRAAALTYFNRSPDHMTAGEAALLVALPQSPSRTRPDRHPERAKAARDKILHRVRSGGAFAPDVIDIALREDITATAATLPMFAPHLADRLKARIDHLPQAQPAKVKARQSWIRADLQRWSERHIRQYVARRAPGASAALLIVENKSRRVIGYVGAADFQDAQSDGYVDMVTAIRSPGSTLKPLIYGLAMDQGMAHPDSRINDVPTAFGAYSPKNFRDRHYGDVSLRDALQLSLNVPAVIALERLGPTSFIEKMRRHGLDLRLPDSASGPGLAIALGGVGTSLQSLVGAYAALADDGVLRPLALSQSDQSAAPAPEQALLDRESRWRLADMLRGVRAPVGMLDESRQPERRDISYKTGTSYGFRDAWAIGYNRDYTVGVWIGRPDGAPNPGHFGASTAAPLLFQAFDRLPDAPGAHLARPAHLREARHHDLPPALKRFDRRISKSNRVHNSAPPQITFPVSGSLLERPGEGRKLVLEAEGGKRPFTWVINGDPVKSGRWSKNIHWRPPGPGFAEIILIDALGRRATADIQIQ